MRTALDLVLLGSLCLPPPGTADDLWDGLREPPAEARPFVRWWWNGNRVTEAEAPRLRFLRLTPVDARQADQSVDVTATARLTCVSTATTSERGGGDITATRPRASFGESGTCWR
jgi:hypothetical protein